jgi:hypothetical protein
LGRDDTSSSSETRICPSSLQLRDAGSAERHDFSVAFAGPMPVYLMKQYQLNRSTYTRLNSSLTREAADQKLVLALKAKGYQSLITDLLKE